MILPGENINTADIKFFQEAARIQQFCKNKIIINK